MNWLDIVIILMLLIPMFIGFQRGLTGIIIPLVGILIGVILAGQFYISVANWLSNWLQSPEQAKIVGFIIIFALVMIAALIAASIARKFLSLLFLGWVDKIGGLVFGLVLGGMFAGALLSLIAEFFPSSVEGTVGNSALAAFLLDKFPFVLYFLPSEFDTVRQLFG